MFDDQVLQLILFANIFLFGIAVAFTWQHFHAHKKQVDKTPRRRQATTMPILTHDMRQRIIDDAEEHYQKALRVSAEDLEQQLTTTTKRLSTEINKMGDSIITEELQRYKAGLAELRDEAQKNIGGIQSEIDRHQKDMREKFVERQTEMDLKLREYEAELQAKLAARNTEIEEEFQRKRAEYADKQLAIESELAQHQTELEAAIKEREAQIMQHQADIDNEFMERQKRHAARIAQMEDKLSEEMEARRHMLSSQLDAKLGDMMAAFLTETLRHNVDLGAQMPYLIAQLDEHKDELKQEISVS